MADGSKAVARPARKDRVKWTGALVHYRELGAPFIRRHAAKDKSILATHQRQHNYHGNIGFTLNSNHIPYCNCPIDPHMHVLVGWKELQQPAEALHLLEKIFDESNLRRKVEV